MSGRQGVAEHAGRMFAVYPDITVNLRSVAASGNCSAREYTVTGTNAATGRPMSVTGVSILEFDGTLIVRNSDYYDRSSLAPRAE